LTAPVSGSRYFISYSRRSPDDSALADNLRAGLESAGHQVFIDKGIRVGTDWVEEIAQRIAWCDYLVVLLSRESVHSEMVLGEVRMAHRRRRRDGRPHILPIRVRYDGDLDYELDSYLARVQYVRWTGAGDSTTILNEILDVAAPGPPPKAVEVPITPRPEPSATDYRRPRPGVGIPPGGTLKPKDPFYVRRRIDDQVEDLAGLAGNTICIRAPRQMGKSSLLIRYLGRCHEAGKRVAFLDFQTFTDAETNDYATLLRQLAKLLLRRLELHATQIPEFSTPADFTAFVEDEVIRNVHAPLTLAFDEVDRVLGRSYQNDFFSMLRLWHNRRAEPFSVWEEVDLALVIATEPYLLIDSKDRSPFNVATPIEPQAFDRDALDDLNGHYGKPLVAAELDDLRELVGGHPYLSRLALYRIVTGQSASFDQLYDSAPTHEGPFGDHLKSMLMLLGEQNGLLPAMQQVIANASVRDEETYYRLHGAGLANREGKRVIPANTLYARFFRSLH
jgi:AAA-like domain/TIR domain